MSLQSMFCKPAMRAAVPVEKRVSTSLWRLVTRDCYRTRGLMMRVSKSTAIQCCHEFVHELNSPQGDFIKITRQDSLKKIEGFSQISKIPNVVAAIDGTHIPIKAPLNNHEDYFNRKHFYSYVMQAVVDSHGFYLSVSTGYPGSLHDARVLRLSETFNAAENENILMEPTVDLHGTVIWPLIVGESAYPQKTWLLRPVKDNGTLTREQKKLSKARICYCQIFSGFAFPFEPLLVSFALLSLVFVVLPRRCLSRLMYDLQTKKSIIFCIS